LTLRQQWRDFIVNPRKAGRHLASIGSAVTADIAPVIDDAAITQFLNRLANGITDVRFLAAVVDLLTSEYDSFCAKELPALGQYPLGPHACWTAFRTHFARPIRHETAGEELCLARE
jgi:hypothetical protein